jgi:seryl-tRNA synthetase
MLDIHFIRENTALVKQGMLNKGEKETSIVDQVLSIDETWRKQKSDADQLRNESNARAKSVGQLMAQGKKEEAQVIIAETAAAKDTLKELDAAVETAETQRNELLLRIPNIPHPSVPVGFTPDDNVTVHTWGEALTDEWRKPHWDLVSEQGWIDFERGVKVTGAGFPFYVGPAARLQRALINYFLDQGAKNGYQELQAPYFVNEDSARGTGQIPDKEDQMYTIPRDGFFAIPTAEVPVTNFHRDEILGTLPVKYCAYTPCWRREAGSYGKDVRGLNRLHQFDKVELVKLVHPDTSYDELESLRRDAEGLLESLGLHYRTLFMCTGDMGFTQTKKYDLEVWSPGQKRWLEVSSCSNFEAFQARRMKIRYRDENGKPQLVHTLNGSGLALPRVMSAILETYQEPSGRILVPEVLKGYLGADFL